MISTAKRTLIPALAGQLVIAAYLFGDEGEVQGVVLTLEDNSDISIEFNCETRLDSAVLKCTGEDDEAVLLQTGGVSPSCQE